MKIPLFTWLCSMLFWTILLGDDVVLVSGQCQNDQQSKLLQLKKSLRFNHSASVKLARWNPSTDCCKWAGITCDDGGRGRVISLDLSNESINGGLDNSNSLFSLQFLQSLNFSFNNFNTTLPARFGNLTGLISLNLSSAGFIGQIPIDISRLTKLVRLDLSTVYFPGVVSLVLEKPNFETLIQNLTQLIELRLDGVNISANGKQWCQALASLLPNLQVLSLSNCFLSGPIDPSLAKLQHLSVIGLGSNNLSDSVPKFFANFSKLSSLKLSSCDLQGTFPEAIFQVPTLEILDLSFNKLLQGSLPEFNQNLSLQTLVLSDTNFSGALPESIGNLWKLSRIELAGRNFTGQIPNSIANLTQLVYLDLSFNMFTGPIASFHMSKNLTYVDLSHNQLTGKIPSSYWEGLTNLISVDLRYNSFNGSVPSSLFAIPALQKIQLSNNQFGGQFHEFSSVSSSVLDTLDLSSNKLEGPIPYSIFSLQKLNVLLLSSNKFNGTVQLDWIRKLGDLTKLDLSYNNLKVTGTSNSTLSSFPQIKTLRLASCNLRNFPDLSNQSSLFHLDLSDNQIAGPIPGWISAVGNASLQYLNLSRNLLDGPVQPFSLWSRLSILDLHHNKLRGNIPTPAPYITFVDYSSNNFTSSIPSDIGNYLNYTFFFSLSNNSLTGAIPQSICNTNWLQILDFSSNKLNGTIPACLVERIETLRVLNLGRNSFTGNIPNNFPSTCQLKTLDLSGNHLQGKVPQALASCKMLEVLDLGNNQINDIFPCLLKTISSFRVLVLRGNMFHGKIGCPKNNGTWPRLQIVDLACNNFSGKLPPLCLKTWKAMMGDGNRTHDHIRFEPLQLTSGVYYQDSVIVTMKGLELELVKILTVFTSIDFSNNKFEGPIPDVIGQFNALYVLNLSQNALTGPIPSAFGNLSQLESLDLSVNHLSGLIPQELTRLTFLSVLNLSYNNLYGPIPTGNQFQTFSNDSFQGNEGLCGHPLTKSCSTTNGSNTKWIRYPRTEFDWEFIVPGLGYGLGAGIVVAPILFCKKVNKWSDARIDTMLLVLFPMLGLRYYKRGDWRIEREESSDEEEHTENDDEDEVEDQENEEDLFRGRYCVFCTKLDITRKRVIHDPKCTCYQSPPVSSPSSSSSSSYSSSSPF